MDKIASLFKERGQPALFSVDQRIIVRGNKVTKIYRILSGQVLIHTTSVRGRDIGIRIVKPDGIIGLPCILTDTDAIVDATAITDCELLFIERDVFERAVKTNPDIAIEAMDQLAYSLIARTRQIEELAVHDFKSRLAAWLLRTFNEKGVEVQAGAVIQVDRSQKLIATMAGASRETVNRQLKTWNDKGIIAVSGKDVQILQPLTLTKLAGNLNITLPP